MEPDNFESSRTEGGLHAPPGLSSLGKVWWWFHFLILLKLARLRFLIILVGIGLVIVKWDTLLAHYDRWTAKPSADTDAPSADFEYFCPMHPNVIRDHPDQCPICHMNLSKRDRGATSETALAPGTVNRVQLSPYRVVQAGIRTSKVDWLPLYKEVFTTGSVEFNEREVRHIAARVKGRIDELYVNETGGQIHEGDPIALIYSPDLLVTVQNLVDAARTGNKDTQRAAHDRLKLWGIAEQQLAEIVKSGKAVSQLRISSPAEGHVIKKYVKEGQYIDEGSPLFDVVDLTTVWIEAQVYEDDMAFLPSGLDHHAGVGDLIPVTATSRAFPGTDFNGWIGFVYPHVDQESRTIVARIEMDNFDHKLRPGTSMSIRFKLAPHNVQELAQSLDDYWIKKRTLATIDAIAHGGVGIFANVMTLLPWATEVALYHNGVVLAVPESAVVDTGKEKIVYREAAPGLYEGVFVTLGPRMKGPSGLLYYPVMAGLESGESVVTDGSFLVDAETRLNPAVGSLYFGGGGGTGKSDVRPSTPDSEDAKIKTNIAKLPGVIDRQLAWKQKECAVLAGSPLGQMGPPIKVMIEGQPVFLCCDSCKPEASTNPAAALAKARKLRGQ